MKTKRENKRSYKLMKFRAGIMLIKNLKNNKLFLKTSTDLDRAHNSDQFQLKMKSHKNKELQHDWNTNGPAQFEFGIFDELKTEETASPTEIKKELKELLELHRVDLLKKGIMLY